MREPPPPELLEQLGIEPRCTAMPASSIETKPGSRVGREAATELVRAIALCALVDPAPEAGAQLRLDGDRATNLETPRDRRPAAALGRKRA